MEVCTVWRCSTCMWICMLSGGLLCGSVGYEVCAVCYVEA